MEIEVGEYCRTPEQGFIGKLVEIDNNVLNYYKIDVGREVRRTNGMSDNYIYSRDGFGLKHSFNITDLIKEGDFVNGQEVITVCGYDKDGNDKDELGITETDDDFAYGVYLEDLNIKSILTKEQYNLNCYRLEE